MIDLKKLDASASLIAGHYQLMLDAMSGHLFRALSAPDPTLPNVRSRLRFESVSSANLFANSVLSEFGLLATTTQEFTHLGLSQVGANLSEPAMREVSSHVAGMTDDVRARLRLCTTHDSVSAERELRRFALRVELLQAATGMNKAGALIRVKLGRASNLTFIQKDGIGRKRRSQEFVRSMVRWHLLGAYVESALFGLAKSGGDLAKVVYADGRKEIVFSITGETAGYPTYSDLIDEFHPNSIASVEAV